ncbi:hypothetical protein C9F11_38510 [Streptomyces sp. YIM 121038]|uniref:hypothetical protein n=1 Tax=Streptomyces sp. YIM 121038 TaxID=2136401 RepID=UPI001110C221|nr:hypothetical protein [Streptomyces sp. YIM 121038]QCX81285.1 hypothetical protein C9F11_38510 [Streptomyces sp. YIM 121038]
MPALIVDATCHSDDAEYHEVEEQFLLLGHFTPARSSCFPAQTAIALGHLPQGAWREQARRSARIGAIVGGAFVQAVLDIDRNGALVAYCRQEVDEIFLSVTCVARPRP